MKSALGGAKGRLMTIVALKEGSTLRLVYLFDTGKKVEEIEKKVSFSKPETDSIAKDFPNAELYEREIAEMFDITFKGNPNPKPLFLMPQDRGIYRRMKNGEREKGV